MINDIIENITFPKNTNEKYKEKIRKFFIATRLLIKSKLLRGKNKKANVSFFGFKISGYDYYTLYFLFKEVFISNEYFFDAKTTAPLIIDCGANIGMSILYFKKLYPSSRITAFEANPLVYKLLQENITQNKLSDIELNNVALYDEEKEIPFYINENIGTLMGSVEETRGGSISVKVPAKRLSSYLVNMDLVDLIKIDVEGAEIQILNDLFTASFINKAKEYIIEYHHNINDSTLLSVFLQKFETNGFKYNIKSDFSGINSFQDLLIHFYKA